MMQATAEITKIASQGLIVYEMPLSDAMRICLRLENLFQQFDLCVNCTSSLAGKNAIDAILKILEVTDRPDIKSKLSQTLTQYTNALSQFRNSPVVHTPKLQQTLEQLEKLNYGLQSQHTRIGEAVRHNEFLSQVRVNLSNPGGVCDYRLPAYQLWQNKPDAEKTNDLHIWIETFRALREIITLLLQLTRESTPLAPIVTEDGFHLQTLNPATHCHLIRVAISPELHVYPEFGAGKHRVTIRFLTPVYSGAGKSIQAKNKISFQLACCKI